MDVSSTSQLLICNPFHKTFWKFILLGVTRLRMCNRPSSFHCWMTLPFWHVHVIQKVAIPKGEVLCLIVCTLFLCGHAFHIRTVPSTQCICSLQRTSWVTFRQFCALKEEMIVTSILCVTVILVHRKWPHLLQGHVMYYTFETRGLLRRVGPMSSNPR